MICIKIETQKIVNLLNGCDNESSKFATRKWYIINDQNNGQYGNRDENGTTIKFEIKVIKSDAFVLVTGDIAAVGGDQNIPIAFKNYAPFARCVTHINDEHIETVENLDIIMPMYNLLEYSHNYANSSGSLWQFKRDEKNIDGESIADVTTVGSSSFKYKSSLLKDLNSKNVTFAGGNDYRLFTNAEIVVLLKYFFRSLEIPLINCKIHLELNCIKGCVMSTIAGAKTFQITSTKLYVSIVTLSTKDNVNLTKELNEGFKKSVYWNEYKSKAETKEADANNSKIIPLDASFQEVNRLFVLAFNNTNDDFNKVERNSHIKCFLPTEKI